MTSQPRTAREILSASRRSSESKPPIRSVAAAQAHQLPAAMSSTLNLTEPSRRMQDFWQRMCRRFGAARWIGQYGEADDGTWDAALEPFSDQVLANAIDRIVLAAGQFLPDLRDFVAVCLRMSGLPDPVVAYHAAARLRWGHAVIYETARRVGFWRMRNGTEAETLPTWREKFGEVCIEFLRGTAPWIQREREARQKRAADGRMLADQRKHSMPSTPESAARHIADIRARLGFSAGAQA